MKASSSTDQGRRPRDARGACVELLKQRHAAQRELVIASLLARPSDKGASSGMRA
jgi:hypothetical protein